MNELRLKYPVRMMRRIMNVSASGYYAWVDRPLSKRAQEEVRLELEIMAAHQRNWGRMAIVDTKPFKLRVILHRIFVERPQVTGIPAWPGGAACYRRSRYIL